MFGSDELYGLDDAVALVCDNKESHCLCVECSERQAIEIASQKAISIIEEEGSSARVLVVTPNRNAKLTFMHEWKHYGMVGARHPRVCTIDEVCKFVLDETNAREALGRGLTVANRMEALVMLEDVKALGMKPRRLKSMVEFMCKGVTEGLHKDDSWLINDEERMVFAELMRCLSERDAVLPCELGALACEMLERKGVPCSCAADYVLVVGYTALDASMQKVCSSLAGKQLLACGLAKDPGVSNIAYPHVAGLRELGMGDDACFVTVLSRDVEDPLLVVFANPEDELESVGAFLEECDQKQAACGYNMVVAPNNSWLRRMQGELMDRGIPVQAMTRPRMCAGDPRNADGNPVELFGALGLVARPDSAIAWRTWIGLGDYLCMSNVWRVLRDRANAMSLKTGDYLLGVINRSVSFEQDASWGTAFERFDERVDLGLRLIDACSHMTGIDLLEEIARCIGFEGDVMEYVGVPVGPSDDVRLIFRRVNDAGFDPMPQSSSRAIVVTPELGRYLTANVVVATGMIDGFIPSAKSCDPMIPPDKSKKLLEEDRLSFDSCLRIASDCLALTAFTEMGFEQANILKADIDRIFLASGQRRARVRPSRLLDGIPHVTDGCLSYRTIVDR